MMILMQSEFRMIRFRDINPNLDMLPPLRFPQMRLAASYERWYPQVFPVTV